MNLVKMLPRVAQGNFSFRGDERAKTNELVPAVLIGAFVPGSGDPANGGVLPTDPGVPAGFIQQQPVQIAPRLGLAYDVFVDGKTAVRAGFGISKQTVPQNGLYLTTQTFSSPPRVYVPQIYYDNLGTFLQAQGVLFPANANADPTSPARALPDNFLRPYPGYANLNYVETSGTSNYNGLHVSVNRRFSRGVEFGLAYSWSKAMGLTDGGGNGARVNVVQEPVLPRGERRFERWFNTNAFARPARGDFGNAAKDVFRLPAMNNWDLTLLKKIPIGAGERRYLQFRWEACNALNHTQYWQIDSSARFDPAGSQVNGRFGQVISTRMPRVMQFALHLYI